MFCLVTRIKVRKLSTLTKIVVAYLRMRQQAKRVSGLLDTSLHLKPQRTVLFVSLWRDSDAMAEFNTIVPEHPTQVYRMRQADAIVWSWLFKFVGTSPSARSWPDLSAWDDPLPSSSEG
jgi:heme-degrading monooxygenase HmoA